MLKVLYKLPFVLLLFVANCSVADKSVVQLPYKVVTSHQHDTNNYTQGLEFFEGSLYESAGQYGQSRIIKYSTDNLATEGLVSLLTKRIPNKYFAEGLTIVDNKLWLLTWRRQTLFKFSIDDFAIAERPISYRGQGWGLAKTNDYFIRSDGSDTLTLHHPKTFEEQGKLVVHYKEGTLDKINELEWVEPIADKPPLLIANRWFDNSIYCIQITADGAKVVAVIDLTELKAQQPKTAEVLNGIAWNSSNQRLWVTGKYWNKIYELEIPFNSLYSKK